MRLAKSELVSSRRLLKRTDAVPPVSTSWLKPRFHTCTSLVWTAAPSICDADGEVSSEELRSTVTPVSKTPRAPFRLSPDSDRR